MKFITIGDSHYNLANVACFWWKNGFLYIQCIGDTDGAFGQQNDPHRAYYRKLCEVTGVLPCEGVS